jgi:hypothetical protein
VDENRLVRVGLSNVSLLGCVAVHKLMSKRDCGSVRIEEEGDIQQMINVFLAFERV